MESRTPPFRYRLAPLLRRDEWEREALGSELQRARLLLEQAQQLKEAALTDVRAAEDRMRELHRQDLTIQLEARRMLHIYLAQTHGILSRRQHEWTQALALVGQVQLQFDAKRLAVRTLERHRERQQQSHRVEAARLQQGAADAAWLVRRVVRGRVG